MQKEARYKERKKDRRKEGREHPQPPLLTFKTRLSLWATQTLHFSLSRLFLGSQAGMWVCGGLRGSASPEKSHQPTS